jgi:hypothetical protein
MSKNLPATAANIYKEIEATKAIDVPFLPLVKDKYIQNYNAVHGGTNGELMYHRNMGFMKNLVDTNPKIAGCTPFSVYACLTTCAAYGYSLDPADEQVYLIPYGNKLSISKQPGEKLHRLYRTKQVVKNTPVTLVYENDKFSIVDGFPKHEAFRPVGQIVAGYVIFTLPGGKQQPFIYWKEDWEIWRTSAPDKNGSNWRASVWDEKATALISTNQPKPNFLKSKIISHACTEKCWLPGAGINVAGVEISDEVFAPDDLAADYTEAEVIEETTAQPTSNTTTTIPGLQFGVKSDENQPVF